MATQPTAALAPASAAGAPGPALNTAPQGVIGPDGMLSVKGLRAAYPMYHDLTDDQFLIAAHRNLYPDIPAGQFYRAVNYDTDRDKYNPTNDMGPGDRFAAGYGKTTSDVIDTAKRLGNAVGLGDYDGAKAAEDQRIAGPLMATGWGRAGKFAGDLAATAVPAAKGAQLLARGGTALAAALPATMNLTRAAVAGATPFAAAAGTGAGVGAALTPDDPGGGAKWGAALGPLGELGGRVAQGVWQGGKAVFDPLTQQGRQRVLRRTMDRFADNPAAVRAAAANPEVLVPGYTPTLAEATGDTGIAQLQRGAATAMPTVANELSAANSQRIQAYRASLDDLAGNDGRRQFFEANRHGNAQQNYGAAYGTPLALTPEIEQEFAALNGRPSIEAARGNARNLAAEAGVAIGDDAGGNVAGLHHMKLSLDQQANAAATGGHTTTASLVGDTRDQFLAALQKASPPYANAMAQYAADSRPINQMAIGQVLRDKMVPAIGDFNEDLARSRASQYAEALRDSGGTARRATGMNNATIENTLEPEQMQTVNGIGRDAARYMQSQEAGKAAGSPTAQYLGAQNILAQTLGPLGLGNVGLDSALGRTAAGVLSLPFRATQSRTEELLARALRDPAVAAQILATRDAAPLIARLQPGAANAAVVADKDK